MSFIGLCNFKKRKMSVKKLPKKFTSPVYDQKGGREAVEQITEVAKYFLSREAMTHKKLQKLCYYAQAWYLANYEKPLFQSHFEAWVHGPVSPELYSIYRDWGWLPISQSADVQAALSNPGTASFLDRVYHTYGHYTGDQLENISHQEDPWSNARIGYSKEDYCRNIISEKQMQEYYGKRIGK